MPLQPTSSVPALFEEIFTRHQKNQSNLEVAVEQLFMELDLICGDVLKQALRLLDEKSIILYTTNDNCYELGEILPKRSSQHIIKIYTGLNFCTCEYFERNVLNVLGNNNNSGSYTCEHVLAVRLAKLLCAPALCCENISKENIFSVLLNEMLPEGILKNIKMLTQSQYSNFKFVGSLEHVKTFYNGIKALNFGENGLFQINEDGFRVTVENGNSIQASLFISVSCFSDYHIDGIVNFSLNMNVIAECLAIFAGIDCSIKMFYKGAATPLIIVLEPFEEENITTECSIKTTHYENPIEFNLDENSPSLNVIFIRGPDLSTIFHDLDKSSEELEILLSPRQPYFKISTLGVMQSETSVEVGKTSDMMLLFNCRETTVERYKSSQIRMILKALTVSTKVAMKTDASGLLEMQFMIQSDEQAEIYIQFYISPLIDLDS